MRVRCADADRAGDREAAAAAVAVAEAARTGRGEDDDAAAAVAAAQGGGTGGGLAQRTGFIGVPSRVADPGVACLSWSVAGRLELECFGRGEPPVVVAVCLVATAVMLLALRA